MGARTLSTATALLGALVCLATSEARPPALEAVADVGEIHLDADEPGQAIDALWWAYDTSCDGSLAWARVDLTLENVGPSSGQIGLYARREAWDGLTPPADRALGTLATVDGALGSTAAEADLSLGASSDDWPEGEVHLLLWVTDGDLDLQGEGELHVSVDCEDASDTTLNVEVQ